MKITFFFVALFLVNFLTCFHAYLQYPLPDIEDAKFIEDSVRVHNMFRSKVNPAASNMLHMSWDAALAKTAKAWAKKCKFKHNTNLKMPGKMHPTFPLVGENIWTGTATIFSVDAAVTDWFNEVRNYDFSTDRCTNVCGHYTQMSLTWTMVVWAESYKVGCAVHFCNTVEYFSEVSQAAHFVCNYGPAGNYPRKPYKAGQPCSGCSNEKCVDKLCGKTKPQPKSPRPHSPRPPVPKYVPPAERPRSSCDQYCLNVLILRPLFLVLSVGAVLLVQQKFPYTFFYE
ncbi:GLIP1 protein, partial [Formicarius rufipectus]|nr:GLIP1 protein [Formicarius rufipectus]